MKQGRIWEVRTDLALEISEQVGRKKSACQGIVVNERKDSKTDIKVTILEITDKNGEKIIGRPQGKYITIEASDMGLADEEYAKRVARILANNLEELLTEYVNHSCSLLVVGLGNRHVTADSLGPDVVELLHMDKHIFKKGECRVTLSGIAPGVMAQTGMETADIVRGIVKQQKPDIVVAIDSLAARDGNRLNTTIQLSNQGIHPGSGVGNHRVGLSKDTMGVPVIAIGVPTVIAAPTIISDALDAFLTACAQNKELKSLKNAYESFSTKERYALIGDLVSPVLQAMYVTPKDIDANVKVIGETIAQGIHFACEDMQMTYL